MDEMKEEMIRKLQREINFYSVKTETLRELLETKRIGLSESQLQYEMITRDLERTEFLIGLLKKYGERDG